MVAAWCQTNQIDLVFLPTYASWLDWIEAEFAAVRYFALDGTDHRSHHERDTAIGAYIRWRNYHAQPKTNFRPELEDPPPRLEDQGCMTGTSRRCE
jgi:hypothetical protein